MEAEDEDEDEEDVEGDGDARAASTANSASAVFTCDCSLATKVRGLLFSFLEVKRDISASASSSDTSNTSAKALDSTVRPESTSRSMANVRRFFVRHAPLQAEQQMRTLPTLSFLVSHFGSMCDA